ncbi:uncharacterized protein LOC108915662 [Anoplophora glabripennis]|uniref:uncharacterized protein LOC108915662 n=1 Tax=Anoplophora glabripennis TaxID=217634 RepID=UPI0008736EEC|nr:uncharacterized protein LOC108915662 [Anoplophora glabripennis]
MKGVFLALFCGIALTCVCVDAIENFLENPLYQCIRCLCHARSGCWIRQNCARYSISRNYWQEAGALTVNNWSKGGDDYTRCMRDENCIVGTIIQYTQKFGKLDCNCDGKFDCKDRFAIHLFGPSCENPKFTSTYARRFNECSARIGVATMLTEEGDNCEAPPVE